MRALHGLIAGQARVCWMGEGPALGLAGTADLAAPEHGHSDLLASRVVAQFEQGLRLVAGDAFVLHPEAERAAAGAPDDLGWRALAVGVGNRPRSEGDVGWG